MRVRNLITWPRCAAALACLLASAICAFAQVVAPSPLRPGEGQGAAADRVALVIGNSAYQHTTGVASAVDDAAAVAASLGRLGFVVNELRNADYDQTRRALISFGDLARRSEIAVIYFAGHGLELDGENWLAPVDAQLQTDTDVEIGATSLHSFTAAVSGATRLGLVILDACRGNPFATTMQLSGRTRAIQRGLARIEPDDNILVAFSARPGTTAIDSAGPHSAFTQALLNNIEEPGLEISYLFRNVHDDVLEATGEVQEPAYYGSLSENEVYLKPPAAVPARLDVPAAPSPPPPVAPAAGPTAEEITWFFLRDSTDAASLQLFVDRFPNGPHRAQASTLIASLASGAKPAPIQLSSSADQIAWSMLRQDPNRPAMRRFLDSFPDSPHAGEAQKLIASLEAQAKGTDEPAHAAEKKPVIRQISHNDPRIEETWHIIRTSRDPNVLKNFAAELPSRQYATEVNARLAELGFDQRVNRLPPREAAELSVSQCDRLASAEVDFSHLSRDAVDACRRAIAARPDIPRLEFQLCRCLFKIKQAEEANEHCNNAVRLAVATGDQNSANFYRANGTALQVAVAPYSPGGIQMNDPAIIRSAPTSPAPQPDTSPTAGSLNPASDIHADRRFDTESKIHDLHAALLHAGSRGERLSIIKQIDALKAEKLGIDKELKGRVVGTTKNAALTKVDTKARGVHKIVTGGGTQLETNVKNLKTTDKTIKVTTVSPGKMRTDSFKTNAATTVKDVPVNSSSLKNAAVNSARFNPNVQAVKVTAPNVKVTAPNVKISTPTVPSPRIPTFRAPSIR